MLFWTKTWAVEAARRGKQLLVMLSRRGRLRPVLFRREQYRTVQIRCCGTENSGGEGDFWKMFWPNPIREREKYMSGQRGSKVESMCQFLGLLDNFTPNLRVNKQSYPKN